MQVKLIYNDGHWEHKQTSHSESAPAEIRYSASKCGKVAAMRFVFDAALTAREGLPTYVQANLLA